jgi:hypothetical protein
MGNMKAFRGIAVAISIALALFAIAWIFYVSVGAD